MFWAGSGRLRRLIPTQNAWVADLLPVWIAEPELACCGEDFAIGEAYGAPLCSWPKLQPVDVTETSWTGNDDGSITAVVEILEEIVFTFHAAIAGSVKFGIADPPPSRFVAGRFHLHDDSHGMWDATSHRRVWTSGIARRIQRVLPNDTFVDVASTSERRRRESVLVHLELDE